MLRSRVKRLRPAGLRARIAIVTVVGLLASVFAIGGVVGYETYFACVNNNSGTIKVVSSDADCNSGDYFIEWNLVGPKGDTGDPGPQGEVGPVGPAGPQGDIGPMGPAGAKGDTGDPGPQGVPGEPGPEGDTGPMGPAGAKGDTGDPGQHGVAGLPGPKGDTGDPGPQGVPGEPGPKGDTGAVGPAGIMGYEIVTASGFEVSPTHKTALAACPQGKHIIGGGSRLFGVVADLADVVITTDSLDGAAWRVTAHDAGQARSTWDIRAFAICAFVDN